jgi:hypothetical protein
VESCDASPVTVRHPSSSSDRRPASAGFRYRRRTGQSRRARGR